MFRIRPTAAYVLSVIIAILLLLALNIVFSPAKKKEHGPAQRLGSAGGRCAEVSRP